MRKTTRMKPTFWSIALATITFGVATDQNVVSNSSNTATELTSLVGLETASRNPDDVRLYLFPNPSDTTQAEEIVFKDEKTLNVTSFKCSKISKILVHGFNGNGLKQSGFPADVIIEYLKQLEYTGHNIFALDYGPVGSCKDPSSSLCYPAAVENLAIAGQRFGEYIVWLLDVCGPQFLDLVHVVGHSLGAHVSGYATNYVTIKTNGKIGRLTGLDPAGPLFVPGMDSPRMTKATDAKFTEAYYTCAGVKGTPCTVAHFNVFVNGGFPPQPGCEIPDLTSVAGCSHAFSYKSYAKSIAFGDPEKYSNASVQACRLTAVDCLIAPDLSSQDCDQTFIYGEHLKPGTVTGTYSAKSPPI